jgi:hypothetical protein
MVVVMAKKQAAASVDMDPHLLALASSGSFEELKSLLNFKQTLSSAKRVKPLATTAARTTT